MTVKILAAIALCIIVTPLLNAQSPPQTESTPSQKSKEEKESRCKDGPVKSIETKQVYFQNWGIFGTAKRVVSWNITTYDRQCRAVESVSLKGNGKPDSKVVFTYDERDNLIETATYNRKNMLTSKMTYRYDQQNRQVAVLWYRPEYEAYAVKANGYYKREEYKYDTNNREREHTFYDGENQLELRLSKTYTLDGKIKERFCESPAEYRCAQNRGVYEYNSHGDVVGLGRSYKYDERGNLLEWEIQGFMRVVRILDSVGNEIESVTYGRDGQVSTRQKYDSKHRTIMHVGLRPDGALEKDCYIREFDEFGNESKEIFWRKKTPPGTFVPSSEWLKEEKDKGAILQVWEQRISYYK